MTHDFHFGILLIDAVDELKLMPLPKKHLGFILFLEACHPWT